MPRPTLLLFVNPRSRQGQTDLEEGIALLKKDFRVIEGEQTEPSAVDDLIRRHPEADRIVLGGGDGTMHHAVAAVVESGLPLGILPLGTANDLARTLQIPPDLREACRIIAAGRTHRIDLGKVNGRYFFNAAHIGLGVEVTKGLSPAAKKEWGVLEYVRSALRAVSENRSFRATISYDGRSRSMQSIQVAVANGRHYGGGMTVAEDADIDDHRLHLFSVAPQSLIKLAALAPALWRGEYGNRDWVLLLHGENLEVKTSKHLAVVADGEPTTRTPAQFQVVKQILPVFVPESYR